MCIRFQVWTIASLKILMDLVPKDTLPPYTGFRVWSRSNNELCWISDEIFSDTGRLASSASASSSSSSSLSSRQHTLPVFWVRRGLDYFRTRIWNTARLTRVSVAERASLMEHGMVDKSQRRWASVLGGTRHGWQESASVGECVHVVSLRCICKL
jgi:hypothetical protein